MTHEVMAENLQWCIIYMPTHVLKCAILHTVLHHVKIIVQLLNSLRAADLYIPYNGKFWRWFNLAIWWLKSQPPN